jgi:ABC-type spermidine/putrescine transport system permease subunit I
VDNELVRRLAWSGILAATGALTSILATKVAALVYRRIFDEDPPE